MRLCKLRKQQKIHVYVYIDAQMRQDCEVHFLVEHASIFYKITMRWRKVLGRGAWLEGGGWGVAGGIQLFNSGCFNRGRPDAMLCEGSRKYLFGCLRVRMLKMCRRMLLADHWHKVSLSWLSW